MVKTMFLVPLADNDGKTFEQEMFRQLEQKLIETFGGFTAGGLAEGAWEDGGKVYRDTTRTYIVVLDSVKRIPAWLEMIEWVRVTFRQIEIYTEISGTTEFIGQDEED